MNIDIAQMLSYLIPTTIWILGISITIRLAFKKQAVSITLAWLLIIYFIPIIGILLYLILGELKLGRRRAERFKSLAPIYRHWFNEFDKCSNLVFNKRNSYFHPVFALSRSKMGIPCVLNNELHILDTPDSIINAIIEDIQHAKRSINMTFYIWHEGGLVNDLMDALVDAVERGVDVKILIDSVGSKPFLRSRTYRMMKQKGIVFQEALHANIFRMFFRRIDLRQHRKIVVIDEYIAYTGSMNMVDPRYFKQEANVGQWIDIMVRMEGPVSMILQGIHHWDWQLETEQELTLNSQCPIILDHNRNTYGVQILPSGPGFTNNLMTQLLVLAISSARQSITITSPYFVPSAMIADCLATAALRGVEVILMVPEKNDSFLVEWASRTFFDELLQAGVKIYRFTGGLLHTKSILIDDRLSLLGTVNMDVRSFILNFEVTMIVDDIRLADEVDRLHQNYLQQSYPMDSTSWNQRPLYQRLLERITFLFSPLL